MKLSIITINFNNAEGLRKTIASVVAQTSPNIEYLVIDGGSTDGSVDVIRDYKDKISGWVSEPDRGIYHAMNKGIQRATGTYCQFLNSGDWLVDGETTKKMMDCLQPDDQVLWGNLIKVFSDKTILKDSGTSERLSMLRFYQGTINHTSSYIKRSLFEKYGLFDENLKIVSDWKFFLIAVGLHNEQARYVDIDVSYFDMSGISNSKPELLSAERRKVLFENVPPAFLADYDKYSKDLIKINRFNRYPMVKKIVCLMDRFLFVVEKYKKV